jgi:hypothetical protein
VLLTLPAYPFAARERHLPGTGFPDEERANVSHDNCRDNAPWVLTDRAALLGPELAVSLQV